MNSPEKNPVDKVVTALSSLKLTVTLLGMAIFLVFAGTLAQREKGICTVMEQYFRCWVAWIEFRVFCPREWNVSGGFPFPGGGSPWFRPFPKV